MKAQSVIVWKFLSVQMWKEESVNEESVNEQNYEKSERRFESMNMWKFWKCEKVNKQKCETVKVQTFDNVEVFNC